MQLDRINLWQFPECDYTAWCELVGGTSQVASHAEDMAMLAVVQADQERQGRQVVRVEISVAEMIAELDRRGWKNSPAMRAAVITRPAPSDKLPLVAGLRPHKEPIPQPVVINARLLPLGVAEDHRVHTAQPLDCTPANLGVDLGGKCRHRPRNPFCLKLERTERPQNRSDGFPRLPARPKTGNSGTFTCACGRLQGLAFSPSLVTGRNASRDQRPMFRRHFHLRIRPSTSNVGADIVCIFSPPIRYRVSCHPQ